MADFRRRAATSPAEYGRNLVEAEVHADMVLRRSLSSLGLDCDVSDATLAVSTSRRNLDGHGSRVDSESSFIHSLWVPSPLSSSPVLGRRFGPQPEDRESPASLTPPPPQDAMGPRPPTAMRSSLSPPPPPHPPPPPPGKCINDGGGGSYASTVAPPLSQSPPPPYPGNHSSARAQTDRDGKAATLPTGRDGTIATATLSSEEHQARAHVAALSARVEQLLLEVDRLRELEELHTCSMCRRAPRSALVLPCLCLAYCVRCLAAARLADSLADTARPERCPTCGHGVIAGVLECRR
mmetsp:Transcript_50997/g.119856  ORF Transcript_50997/g.119856 Transcript_50997/m.119856 type:complete len:295 (-) Transcript_50997:238-1122(-)